MLLLLVLIYQFALPSPRERKTINQPRVRESYLHRQGVGAMGLNWNDSQEIGELLFEKYDSVKPMSVKLGDVKKWVLDLEDFSGKAAAASEESLEAIQKAWHEEWKLEYGDD